MATGKSNDNLLGKYFDTDDLLEWENHNKYHLSNTLIFVTIFEPYFDIHVNILFNSIKMELTIRTEAYV